MEERAVVEKDAAEEDEVALISLRRDYVRHRNWVCNLSSKTYEELVASFPVRHSCQHCKEGLMTAFRPKHPLPTFLQNVDQAIKAATNDCLFYGWLLDFVIRSRPRELIGTEGFWVQLECFPGSVTDMHSVQFMIGTENYSWPCATFDVFADTGNAAAPYISSRPFNADVGSEASFRVANRWLAECQQHRECRASIQGVLPIRLVDLRSQVDADFVRLVSTQSLGGTGKSYATLSYCWGGDQTVKTCKETLTRHEVGIRISKLGKTIRDAIKVARMLEIEFLWIDSLCIIQDNPEDVASEVSKMSEYYENSFLCISAAAAVSCGDGFLHPRNGNPYRNGPFELPYRGPDNRIGSIKLVNYADYSNDLEPAKARAWIMQESLLAPRLLSYSYRNLAWSCRKVSLSDGGPYRAWHDFGERTSWAELLRQRFHCGPIKYWKDLVESYSTRGHTFPKDKFPAMSGMAQKYAQIMVQYAMNEENWPENIRKEPPSKAIDNLQPRYVETNRHVNNIGDGAKVPRLNYLTGIWYFQPGVPSLAQIIHEQLFWTTPLLKFRFSPPVDYLTRKYSSRPGGSSVRRFREYIAPSWSWAAIDGPILYEDLGRNMRAARDFEIVDMGVTAEIPQGPYGAITSGFLTVRGRMREVPTAHELDDLSLVYRPDAEDDVIDLERITEGKMQGWLVEMLESAGDAKPVIYWNAKTPKGLILVAEGTKYRRIGLFSVSTGGGSTNPFCNEEALASFFGEPQTITIV